VVTFLAIHPFQDGNGRLSRILTTLLLLKAGYGYVPYASLESIVEESKEGYYLALRQTQGTLKPGLVPNWEPWLLFFLRVLQRQKTRLQTKLDNEQIMAASLPLLSVRILELVKEQGRVTVQGIEQATGESRGTIKLRLKQLTEDRLLVRYGKGRSTWYGLS
jgi:Fic family protein